LSVGVKDVSTNVVLGNRNQPVPPARPGAINLTPDFPLPVQPPPFTPPPDRPVTPTSIAPPPPPPVVPCPETNPDLEILNPASQDVPGPPLNATYPFRVMGTFAATPVGGAPVKSTYPPLTTRTITRLPDTSAGTAKYWNFSQSTAQGSSVSTTFFSVEYVNTSQPAPGVPYAVQADLRGLYLTGIDIKRLDGSIDSFRPQPALLVMKLPAVAGDAGNSAGTDPLSQTTMKFRWRNAGRPVGTVRACGLPVGAFRVDLTEGQVIGNASGIGAKAKNLTFSASYYVATQSGAILVGDSLKSTGSDGLTTVDVDTTSFINVVPRTK